MCQAEPRCAAAVWNGGTDRWCNLKWSGTKHRRSKAGEQLVQIRPPPPNPLPPPPPPAQPVKPPPASQPDWATRYHAGHLLYADAASVATQLQQHIMPEVGNGYVGVQAHGRPSVVGDYLMVGGVYNGRADSADKELDGPSHRAKIPSFLPSIAGATAAQVAADTALDMERATFITRGTVAADEVAVEQRLYAHWTRPHLLVQEFQLTATEAGAEVAFTEPLQESLWTSGPDFEGHALTPAKPGLRIVEGQTRISETTTSNTTRVVIISTTPAPVAVAAHTTLTVYVLHAIVTSLNGTNDFADLVTEGMALHHAGTVAASQLWDEHTEAWGQRWSAGRIEIGGDLALAQTTNSSLYFLLSAIREDWVYGLSPGGLASSAYDGHVFWDMDTWMYPPLAVLHSELGKGCLAYRMARRSVARLNAQAHGFNGTMFPWESALTGIETSPAGDGTHGACSAPGTPPPPPLWFEAALRSAGNSDSSSSGDSTDTSTLDTLRGRGKGALPRVSTTNAYGDCEQHINADISLATRQMWQLTHDKEWLLETGYPLAQGIAEFWASKAVRQADGHYHILKVMGPDEYHQLTDDNAYTNSAAATALEFAAAAAGTLGLKPPEEWREISRNMFIPYNETVDFHPEYMSYYGKGNNMPTGPYAAPEVVKQADTILIGFPLGVNMSSSTRRNDLNIYNRTTTASGPAMTWAMFAVGYLDIGDEATAHAFFTRGYANALNGAFGVWQETPHGGAVNFLTGAGGFLQSVIFGYGGLRLSDDALLLHPPQPPGNATSVGLHGVDYQGVPLAITTTKDEVTVEILQPKSSESALGPRLEIRSLVRSGPVRQLVPGVPISLPRAQGAVVAQAA